MELRGRAARINRKAVYSVDIIIVGRIRKNVKQRVFSALLAPFFSV